MKEAKHFIATWPELNMSVECEPRENGANRWIYDWYIEHMPIKYLQLHAAVCGKVIYTWTRVSETLPVQGDNELVKTKVQDAPIGFGHMSFNVPNGLAGGRSAHLAFAYGDSYEDMDGYYSFKVVDRDLDKLVKVGEMVAKSFYKTKQVITCTFSVKED